MTENDNDILEVPDLDSFEPCGLWDAEIGSIIDNGELAFALDEDIGRKDPEDSSVWTLCWYRVRPGLSSRRHPIAALPERRKVLHRSSVIYTESSMPSSHEDTDNG